MPPGDLERAIALARPLGLRLKIFDALRPSEAQWALWNARPDPEFLADPRRGSPHSRGVAVDLTLVDGAGAELDMGTGFDAFTPLSHHAATEISAAAQRNRFLLLGLMSGGRLGFLPQRVVALSALRQPELPAPVRRRIAAADDGGLGGVQTARTSTTSGT